MVGIHLWVDWFDRYMESLGTSYDALKCPEDFHGGKNWAPFLVA